MSRKIRYGMVGGGRGAFIGAVHRIAAAMDQQVAYIPGVHFSAEGAYTNALRLNYSNNTPERIAEGIRRLAAVVRSANA